jgi:hypothetical protein
VAALPLRMAWFSSPLPCAWAVNPRSCILLPCAPQDKELKPQDVYFLDIGSNLGIFTLSAAAHGFQVIAFEPMYSNQLANRLSACANPRMHRRVTLINKVGGGGSSSKRCCEQLLPCNPVSQAGSPQELPTLQGLGKAQTNCTLHSDVNNAGDGAMLCDYSMAIPSQAAE